MSAHFFSLQVQVAIHLGIDSGSKGILSQVQDIRSVFSSNTAKNGKGNCRGSKKRPLAQELHFERGENKVTREEKKKSQNRKSVRKGKEKRNDFDAKPK